MDKKHNLRVRPLSSILMGARLANSEDREKANELIMIYSLTANKNNIDTYFDFTDVVSSDVFKDETVMTIESTIAILCRFAQWKEKYKSLIYFKGGNDE